MARTRLTIAPLAAALLTLLAAGCAERRTAAVNRTVPPSAAVRILEPPMSNRIAQAGMALLTGLFPDARIIPAARLRDNLDECRSAGAVLLIPDPARIPINDWTPLQDFLNEGGAALFIGCDPFRSRVRIEDGHAMSETQLFELMLRYSRSDDDLSPVQRWQRVSSLGAPQGTVLPARSAELPWPGAAVELHGFEKWDFLVRDGLPDHLLRAKENTLAFFARGDRNTSRLVVTCDERDGSVWTCAIPVTENWTAQLLHEARFRYSFGGKNRGGKDDSLSLSRLRKIAIGLSTYVAPQPPGDHAFGVSDVRLTTDPRPAAAVTSWPDIPLVSPPYRTVDFTASEIALDGDAQLHVTEPTRMQGPLPRARGFGGADGAPYRWIPIAAARGDTGERRGWVASMFLQPLPDGGCKRVAWIGLDPLKPYRDTAAELLIECVNRLRAENRLYRAGCGRFSFPAGMPILVSAQCGASGTNSARLRVAVELRRSSDDLPLRRTVAACPSNNAPVELNLGPAPEVKGAEEYTVRVTLEDAFLQGRVMDQIEQPILVVPAFEVHNDDEWITALGPRFALAGKTLFLLGINYWPLNTNGKMPDEWNPHWLDPAVFDPQIVEEDLSRLESVGINAVSIQYHDEKEAPQLRYFIEAARRHGLWVHLFVSHLQPLDQDLAAARRLIDSAELANQPQVFAIDIAWEPNLGRYASRCRFDGEWRRWLEEQYGSIEHAEQTLGRPLWRKDNQVTGPSDGDLTTNGEQRVAVEAYRRFVDDFISRRYGEVERFLRQLGCRQLLSARTGFGGTGSAWADPYFPMDPASGTVHLDFVSPEGWGLFGPLEPFYEAGFITAYARGVSGGKPVAWMEFGASVGTDPQPLDLENQARIYHNMFELAAKSRAAACFGWWYPGGYRVDERTDMGVVNPDGTWRPVGEVYREFAHRLRREKSAPGDWLRREVDRAASARGLSALWDSWREVYRQETADARMEEVRPAGFGQWTVDLPVRSIGGVPYSAPAPLEYANGEWGAIDVDGSRRTRSAGAKISVARNRKIRLELINTGPANWTASQQGSVGSVWVAVESADGTPQLLPVPASRFGDRVWISWTPSSPGIYRLRPFLFGSGPFGEALTVEVADVSRDL